MTVQIVSRVAREKRRIVIPLAAAALVNPVVYLAVVVPLAARVGAADHRVHEAETARESAQRDDEAARATAQGKTAAQKDLAAFYKDVLPPDLAGARRITYKKLDDLARGSKLKPLRATNAASKGRNSTLSKLTIEMVLEGQYENVKKFVHALETSQEFMVLENMALAESLDAGGALVLTIEVATYFRSDPTGA